MSEEKKEVLPVQVQPEAESLVTDEALLGIYGEILQNLREEREETKEYLDKFGDLVMNDGDATTASKEALVNLIKIKTETTDKMSKIADLMTRVKLKSKDTFPAYLNKQLTDRREQLKKIHRENKAEGQ